MTQPITIADAAIALGADFEQLLADAEKGGKAAGDKAGASFGAQFGSKARAAVGTAAGAVVGIALSGGAELDRVMGNLKADTGEVGDEAAKTQAKLLDMYSNGIESMDQIGTSMAKLHDDLGLTGDALDAASEKFVNFQTATGQGADSVDALSMDLKAWNKTAADAGPLMDELVASHQKFGTSVAADEASLQAMAPAMQAANMTLDDGVGLLNLFSKAGIDASKAPMALATAVKHLKPGQDLNDLIAQISSITDPTLRAQAAMTLFGSKGGTQLAEALKPGITSLDQFKTSTADTVGATDRASQAIKDEWGNRAVEIFHKAAGALAGIGQQFGPLVSAAALAGPKLTTAFTSALGGLAGMLSKKITEAGAESIAAAATVGTESGAAEAAAEVTAKQASVVEDVAAVVATKTPVELAAAGTLGTAAGAAEGAAEAVAVGAAGPAVAAAIIWQEPEITAAAASVGAQAGAAEGAAMAGGSAGGGLLGSFKAVLASPIGLAAASIGAAAIAYTAVEAWAADQSKKNQSQTAIEAKAATDQQIQDTIDALKAGQKQVPTLLGWDVLSLGNLYQDQIDTLTAEQKRRQDAADQQAIDDAAAAGKAEAMATVDAQIAAIQGAKSALTQAWTDTVNATTRAVSVGYDEQDNLDEQASLKKLMNNKKAWSKLSAQEKRQDQERLLQLQASYAGLAVEDSTYGTLQQQIAKTAALLSSKAMKDGLASSNPDIATMWQGVKEATDKQLQLLVVESDGYGAAAAAAFIAGLNDPANGLGGKTPAELIKIGQSDSKSQHASTPAPGAKTPAQTRLDSIHGTKYDANTHQMVSYDVGTPYVEYDQIAQIHKGERILTAADNAALSAGASLGDRPQIIQLVVSGKVLASVLAHQGRLGG